jgi:hypothetical protein
MLGPTGPLQAATDRSLAPLGSSPAGLGLALRGVAAAGILALLASVVLATATLSGPGAGHAPMPTAAQVQSRLALSSAPAYTVRQSPNGLVAVNPAQGLRAAFSSSGTALRAGALRVLLKLRGTGYGSSLAAAAAVAPSASANRVAYAHPGVLEWYANGPAGLEQGFTLARAPRAPASGPLRIELGFSGNAAARLSADARSISFSRPGAPSLSYGELHASDASGRSLPSWLTLRRGTAALNVDARGARYPLRVDPLVQQGAKIASGGEESPAGLFGSSVALSGDGNTALVGSPHNDGAAFAFTHSGSAWVRQGPKLLGHKENLREGEEPCIEEQGEEAGCGFGVSLALSADGNTALIGSPREKRPCPTKAEPFRECINQGAAWVLTRTGATWSNQAILLGGEEEGASGRFGRGVALSADGKTALVGAPAAQGHVGAAWVFTRSGTTWTQQPGRLAASGEVGQGHFGYSLALSADGTTALIGGPADSQDLGAAWSFTRSGATWAQGAKLTGAPGEIGEAHFGASVALAASGELALIGALADDHSRGAAWSFMHSGANWGPGEKLIASGDERGPAQFGSAVALSGTGNLALVGGPLDHLSIGAAWSFTRTGGTWSPQHQKLRGAEEEAKAHFGNGVALSANGETALVGGPFEADRTGALWAFTQGTEVEPPPEEEIFTPTVNKVRPGEGPATGGTAVTISGTHLAEVTAVEFGATNAKSFGYDPESNSITAISPPHAPGTVHVVVRINASASETAPRDQFTFTAVAGGQGEAPGTLLDPRGGGIGAGGVSGFGPVAVAPSCRPSLVLRNITVDRKGRTSVKLRVLGAGPCRERLTLTVRQKLSHRRVKLRTIATGTFSIPSGRVAAITLKLNRLGTALLRAGHGRLAASLAIVRLSPAPVQAHTASVRLTLQSAHKSPPKKH